MYYIFYLLKRLLSLVGLFDKEARKIHITCVGMENSRKFGNCPGAGLDATNIYTYCRNHITKNIKLLIDGAGSKSSVIQSFSEGFKSDLNILFYSGHGGQTGDKSKDETDGKDEFLCLYDQMMTDDEIWNLVTQCKGRVFLIFDCCHSGTMYREAPKFDKSLPRDSKVSLMCWSGCPDENYSYGGNDGGVFTNAIMKRLKRNGIANYKDMFNIVKRYVSGTEKAQMTCIGKGWNVRAFR